MRIPFSAGAIVSLAALLALSTSSTFAQAPAPAMHPAVPGTQLVNVSVCNPQLNLQTVYAGYAPGYYGPGAYWPDVYGYRYYYPPAASSTTANPMLAIDYKNISPKTMSSIEFGLIANDRLVAEVRDVGTFTTGAEIKHKFAISANVFPLQTGLPRCVPLRITFADGTKWRNPHLPPPNQHIYLPPPHN
jgi:hypothetical protein